MIDIYGVLAVGFALFFGLIPIFKGWHKRADALIMYVDNRTFEERMRDDRQAREMFEKL